MAPVGQPNYQGTQPARGAPVRGQPKNFRPQVQTHVVQPGNQVWSSAPGAGSGPSPTYAGQMAPPLANNITFVKGRPVQLDKSGYAVPGPYKNHQRDANNRKKQMEEQENRRKANLLNQQRLSAFVPYLFEEKSLLGLTQPQIDNCENLGKTPLWLRLNVVLEMEDIQSRIFRPLNLSPDEQQLTIVINSEKFSVRLENTGKNQWKLRHLLAKWIVEYYGVEMMDMLRGQGIEQIHDSIMAWSPARCMREKCAGYSFEIISGKLGKEWTVKMVLNGTEDIATETAPTQEAAENALALSYFHNPENTKKLDSIFKLPDMRPPYEKTAVPGIKKLTSITSSTHTNEGPANKKQKLNDSSEDTDKSKNGDDSEESKKSKDSEGHRVRVPIDTSSLHKQIEIDYTDIKKKNQDLLETNEKSEFIKVTDKSLGTSHIKSREEILQEEIQKSRQRQKELDEEKALKKATVKWDYNVQLNFLVTEQLAADYLEYVWLKLAKDSCTPYTYSYDQEAQKFKGTVWKCKITFGDTDYLGQGSNKLKAKVMCQIKNLPGMLKSKHPNYKIIEWSKTTNWANKLREELKVGVPVPISFWQENHFRYPKIKSNGSWDE